MQVAKSKGSNVGVARGMVLLHCTELTTHCGTKLCGEIPINFCGAPSLGSTYHCTLY